jgi:hypothetical protein
MKPAGFSPKARWDRHIPETDNRTHDVNSLNEKIEVLVNFKNGKIYPKAFIWNSQEYKIKRITYNWQERKGEATINYFSVNTGADLYQISFNSKSNGWRLNKLIE